MRKIFILIGAGLFSSQALADWTGKDASNVTITFKNANVCSSVVCVPIAQPVDSTGAAFGVTANPIFVAPGTGQTFPVSAAALPLPTGAATAVKQPALGTAGAASTDVLSVQGIASMTPFLANPGTAANWGVGTSTQNSATVANGQLALGQFNTSPTTITTGNMSPVQMDSAANLLVNLKTAIPAGANLIGKAGIDQTTPGTTNLVNSKNCDASTPTQCGSVKAASTAPIATDPAIVTTKSPNSPDAPFAAYSTASITRPANTTTYTTNTGWCTLTSSCVSFFSFTAACRVNGGQVLIPRIDIWSSANPTLKLTGVLYLFSAVPGTNISDDATFTIASADFANLTGNFGGFSFALGNNQASGASNSSTSLTGTTYQAQCASGTTTITGMVEVTNAYVPASAEVLHVGIATTGMN